MKQYLYLTLLLSLLFCSSAVHAQRGSWTLTGRQLASFAKPKFAGTHEGKVFLIINVSPDGKVSAVTVDQKKTTIRNQVLIDQCITAAKGASFSKSATGKPQIGNISYTFTKNDKGTLKTEKELAAEKQAQVIKEADRKVAQAEQKAKEAEDKAIAAQQKAREAQQEVEKANRKAQRAEEEAGKKIIAQSVVSEAFRPAGEQVSSTLEPDVTYRNVLYCLPGRELQNTPKRPAYSGTQSGRVVISFMVTQKGEVSGTVIEPTTTISDEALLDECRKTVKKFKFDAIQTPKSQTGIITYQFQNFH
ncbi:MAG: hypothetical protein K6D57_06450 [Paludibacteraceae bacterium]|nr:hypothetical protein [Paludibacteraceae bacterium]